MDAYEATKIVYQRIQSLDPENASKIMGILLIQDHGEKEMIRLAFGPEALVHSVVLKARKELGVSSNSPSTPSTPSSPSPFGGGSSVCFSRQNSSSSATSGRILGGLNLPSPLSITSNNNHSSTVSASWSTTPSFSDFQDADLVSPSASTISYPPASTNGINNSTMNSSAPPYYCNGEVDLIDEFQLQDQLSFLNDGSPTLGPKNPDGYYPQQQDLASSPSGDSMLFSPYNWGGGCTSVNGLPHRRSYSVSDICLGPDDPNGGLGWKPCLYFARGYCKNGSSCRFLHGAGGPGEMSSEVGSPNKFEMMEHCHELLRSKSAHQQRLATASQLMSSSNFPLSPMAANKCMNFLQQQQLQSAESPRAAAALMMADDLHKLNRSRFERGDFGLNGGVGIANPGSRQIYLTFPADSTFKEEDVSNYFNTYGPVQDVRIPYQQKRMFGFVTFVYPETVKTILAKGNPHFVCDARVLVKPYKEKGKVPEKFRKQHQQQMERGEFTGCGSPTGLESGDPFDLQLGARMFYNTQDAIWRRKLEEQADLQQAIELQSRRLMNLQLLDVKRSNHHRALSMGAVIPSPPHSPGLFNHNMVRSTDFGSREENGFVPKMANLGAISTEQTNANLTAKEREGFTAKDENSNGKESSKKEASDCQESNLEHNLPDSPFASPKAVGDFSTTFSNDAAGEADKGAGLNASSSANNNMIPSSSLFPAASSLDMTPFKSCYLQVPRFPSGHGAIGM
ncbi:putative zinc finger CCCH domain-containing protein 53-like isoform X2 [Capsicum annuum]|uniref:zinc finger CCCH domain-containing protein 53 isoform X1 n=1 Tax=Capsicum annuum TaxID=4072 RepID=UPI0007BF97C0|nr:zinc finger CCCH domain-containing protein 53 isoform X1 [Capsicum annuum]KAF3655812.1 putative zinc finger CCCH domain-containing protein 53-like isoform X2 [Capsicum annuum]KAF3663213.1 putative zinc finger CCCH domain-containing protein 53-like isoform X2 [Capsicum annuum]